MIITFGPSGNLDSVQYWSVPKSGGERRAEVVIATPITPVYLLVGQPVGDTNTTLNHVNQENIWVAINPQSGLVTTSEVGYGRDQLPSNPTQQDLVSAHRLCANLPAPLRIWEDGDRECGMIEWGMGNEKDVPLNDIEPETTN